MQKEIDKEIDKIVVFYKDGTERIISGNNQYQQPQYTDNGGIILLDQDIPIMKNEKDV